MNTTTFSGKLENPARFNAFGFVISDDKSQTAILYLDMLNACGFTSQQITEASTFVVEAAQTTKGLRVVRVVTLDGVEGRALAPKPVKVEVKKAKATPKKTPSAEPRSVTLETFVNTAPIYYNWTPDDQNPNFGKWLYSVNTKDGEFIQYIVVKDRVVIQQLGKVSAVDALKAIGANLVMTQVDHNKTADDPHCGESLYSVKVDGKLIGYVVFKDGVEVRQLGKISLAEARQAIGRVIQPLVPVK
jgi:hypothetical protein